MRKLVQHHIEVNQGKFLLLSAVLPNAEDLSEWLTGSSENVYKENWRPSDERIGIMEWNGVSVNLNWRNTDTERDSFNPNFIIQQELPREPRQRKVRYFPQDKNQAIATTAYKLKNFGPVLIFVGIKKSVFTIAREYEKCLQANDGDYIFKDQSNWQAFQLACIESYGEESEWLKFAKKGIFCHNADLLSDVRLPLERLMRSEKARVIIATSTLGQGVNLGVSTVIFATLYQGQNAITKRDFWNIAGRAGRAFVDHEGKILVAQDITGKDQKKIDWDRNFILDYLNKGNIDKAESGCLKLIMALKNAALRNGVSFESLINLLADNNLNEIHEDADKIETLLDWIDDGLLALHNSNNIDGHNDLGWIDRQFSKSLAYLQAKYYENITGIEVLEFAKARIKGIIKKVGNTKESWEKIVSSGIPINSDMQIEEQIDQIIDLVQKYIRSDMTVEGRILLLSEIEATLHSVNVFRDGFVESDDLEEIRKQWLSGVPISTIAQYEDAVKIITDQYSFNLPWILNGISKKISIRGLNEEANIVEELALLVELGLPNMNSVKVYQAGIRSRSSAKEIAGIYNFVFEDMSIRAIKEELTSDANYYKEQVSENAASWIDLLARFSKRDLTKVKKIPAFTFNKKNPDTSRLIARRINDKQYLLSPDLSIVDEINDDEINFSEINNLKGIYFDYDIDDKVWKMNILNPYIKLAWEI